MNDKQRGRQPPPAPKNINLTLKQHAAIQQIEQDNAEIADLREREKFLLARINANRGKLELIAELAEEYGTVSQIEESPSRPSPTE